MPTISLMGSHGTGKTTVYEAIQKRHPDFVYFSGPVRRLLPALGYTDVWQPIQAGGRAVFELVNMSTWVRIDPELNTCLKPGGTIVTDRSVVDSCAYYLTDATERDLQFDGLLRRLARHYASLTNKFVYFPAGVFPLKDDGVRPGADFQTQVDAHFAAALRFIGIPESKVHRLQSTAIEDRVEEVLQVIESCK